MINRKSIVNSPDDRLRQFNRMPIPSVCVCVRVCVCVASVLAVRAEPSSRPEQYCQRVFLCAVLWVLPAAEYADEPAVVWDLGALVFYKRLPPSCFPPDLSTSRRAGSLAPPTTSTDHLLHKLRAY